MAEDRDALLQHYQRMRQELLAAIEGLSDESMTEPSLDGWSDPSSEITGGPRRAGGPDATTGREARSPRVLR
jgi:hypothetical protein